MFKALSEHTVQPTNSEQKVIRDACAAYLRTEMEEPIVLPTPAAVEAAPEEGPMRMRLLRTIAVWLQREADVVALPLGFYAAPALPRRGNAPALPARLMVRARG